MNANELAFHSLIVRLNGAGYYEAATMLRQLYAENKELHAIAQRMSMAESEARKSLQNYKDYQTTTDTSKESVITWKLETKFKELTDKEIKEIFYRTEIEHGMYENDAIKFAKAILRKAQEK